MARINVVCSLQQSTSDNEDISVHDKLWQRIKNGSKHKEKRKNRKSNGVYEKDEESAGRSRDSIKEGLGGDEAISR